MPPTIRFRARLVVPEGPPGPPLPAWEHSAWELLEITGERVGTYPTFSDALVAVRSSRPMPRRHRPQVIRHWLEGPKFAQVDIQLAVWIAPGGRLKSMDAPWWQPHLRPR